MASKTLRRCWWAETHKAELEKALQQPRNCSHRNAALCGNDWTPGMYWWAKALKLAGIAVPTKNYWSGFLPTPSTAIPSSVAKLLPKDC